MSAEELASQAGPRDEATRVEAAEDVDIEVLSEEGETGEGKSRSSGGRIYTEFGYLLVAPGHLSVIFPISHQAMKRGQVQVTRPKVLGERARGLTTRLAVARRSERSRLT